MLNDYILKTDILEMIELKINKWNEIKGKHQDVTHENFIEDVLLTLNWVKSDIENMNAF